MTNCKYANSVWTEILIDDVEIVSENQPSRKTFFPEEHISTSNDLKLFNISAIFKGEQRSVHVTTPIIIDDIELEMAKTQFKGMRLEKKLEICATLTSFMKTFPEKKVYMRYFNDSKRDENRRVFMADVMEAIPILLDKQKTHAKKLNIRLKKYQKQWVDITKNCDTLPTLNFRELKTILESFDIDKSLITLVPDMLYFGQMKYLLHARNNYSSLTIDGPDGAETVPVTHGIFLLFGVFVMEVDWNLEVICREHGGSCNLKSYRDAILKVLKGYLDMGERMHVTKRKLVADLAELKSLCNYKLRFGKPFTPALEFLYCDFSDKISIYYLVSKIKKFHLTNFTNPSKFTDEHLKNVYVPVWKARIVFVHLWTLKFFGNEHPDLKDIVVRACGFRVPCIRWDEEDLIAFMLSSDPGLMEEEEYVGRKNTTDLLEPVLEVTSAYCRFSHPWFTHSAIRRWYNDPNIVRCGKWAFQDSTEEIRDGERVAKRVNMEKLVNSYKTRAEDDFEKNLESEKQMRKHANEILKQILLNDSKSESESESEGKSEGESESEIEEREEDNDDYVDETPPEYTRESWESAEEDELIDGIRQLCSSEIVRIRADEKPPAFIGEWNKLGEQFEVELKSKIEKKAVLLGQFNRLEKRGLNQWRNVRTLKKIVEDSPRLLAVNYYDFLETKQKLLMRKYRDELQKELDEAKRRCQSKERQIRSLQLQYSSKCEPSTSSEAID